MLTSLFWGIQSAQMSGSGGLDFSASSLLLGQEVVIGSGQIRFQGSGQPLGVLKCYWCVPPALLALDDCISGVRAARRTARLTSSGGGIVFAGQADVTDASASTSYLGPQVLGFFFSDNPSGNKASPLPYGDLNFYRGFAWSSDGTTWTEDLVYPANPTLPYPAYNDYPRMWMTDPTIQSDGSQNALVWAYYEYDPTGVVWPWKQLPRTAAHIRTWNANGMGATTVAQGTDAGSSQTVSFLQWSTSSDDTIFYTVMGWFPSGHYAYQTYQFDTSDYSLTAIGPSVETSDGGVEDQAIWCSGMCYWNDRIWWGTAVWNGMSYDTTLGAQSFVRIYSVDAAGTETQWSLSTTIDGTKLDALALTGGAFITDPAWEGHWERIPGSFITHKNELYVGLSSMRNSINSTNSPASIYKTIDGTNWVLVWECSTTRAGQHWTQDVWFVHSDDTRIVAHVDRHEDGPGDQTAIYKSAQPTCLMISEDSGSTWTVIATPDNAGTHSYYNAVGPIYVEDWGRWYFAWIYHGNLLGGVSFPLPNAAYQVFSIDLATETTWTLHASKDQDTSQTVTQLSNLYFSTVRGGALYRLPDPDYEPPS